MILLIPLLLNLVIYFEVGDAKQTLVSFYMHDNVFPPNQSALPVVVPTNNLGFGTVTIIDDALTEGPLQSSTLIGRGQGTWMVASQDGFSLLMTFAVVFLTGEFKGSTLSLHGNDKVTDPVREIAVIGGTGQFRFARGFASITTASVANSGATVTLKVDITVNH